MMEGGTRTLTFFKSSVSNNHPLSARYRARNVDGYEPEGSLPRLPFRHFHHEIKERRRRDSNPQPSFDNLHHPGPEVPDKIGTKGALPLGDVAVSGMDKLCEWPRFRSLETFPTTVGNAIDDNPITSAHSEDKQKGLGASAETSAS